MHFVLSEIFFYSQTCDHTSHFYGSFILCSKIVMAIATSVSRSVHMCFVSFLVYI